MRLIDMPETITTTYRRMPHRGNPEVIHHKHNPTHELYSGFFIERFYKTRPGDALWTDLELLGYGLKEARKQAFGRSFP